MTFLGKLTWRISQKYIGKKGCGNYKPKKRPLFLPSKYLISSFQLAMKYRDGKDGELSQDVEFNATRVAIKYVSVINRWSYRCKGARSATTHVTILRNPQDVFCELKCSKCQHPANMTLAHDFWLMCVVIDVDTES